MSSVKRIGLDEPISRDMQAIKDVGEMQDLGRFDKEFTMFGCCCLQKGQVQYVISDYPDKLYSYRQDQLKKGRCPSPVICLQEILPVPSGLQEVIAQTIKRKLAKKLRELYPKSFLESMEDYNGISANNAASELLWVLKDKLDGTYDHKKLQIFEGLLQMAYVGKVLSADNYQALNEWLFKTRKDMEDDVVVKDIYERTFYGAVYRKSNGQLTYLVNALPERIYENTYKLEQQGIFVSPIFKKTFWYNYEYTLLQARHDFEQNLQCIYTEEYMQLVEMIKSFRSNIDKEAYEKSLLQIDQLYGHEAWKMAQSYKMIWNL